MRRLTSAVLTMLVCAWSAMSPQSAGKPVVGGGPRVSPDGAQVLFNSRASGTNQLFVMRADGSEIRQLTTDSGGAHSGNWSPDGRRIVYMSGSRIIVVGTDGANRRVVSDAAGNQSPSWWPGGARILFAGGQFPNINIYSINVDGSGRRNIAPNPGFDFGPAVSPDGRLIAFVSGSRGRPPQLFVMNADGTSRRRIADTPYGEEAAAWSPDGKRIAFQASGDTAGATHAWIYVTEVSTGTTRRVTGHARPRLDETPSWFPDGQTLAIQSDRDGTWSIYTIGVDGTTQQRLTKAANYYNPRWSPDGRTLLFESTRDGRFAIYTAGLDGSRLTKLTDGTSNDEQPNWSPDGRRIVFSSGRDGHSQLYLMNSDGTDQTQLTHTASGGEYQSSFSPDGQWIVFQGRADNALVNEQVYVVRVDGTGRRQLTDSTTNNVAPRWTADGRITFTQSRYRVRRWKEMTPAEMARGKETEVTVTMRPDGTGATQTAKSGGEEAGRVSPDGRLRVYERNEGDQWGIYVVDLETGQTRAVVGGRAQLVMK